MTKFLSLVYASTNTGKVAEAEKILADLKIKVRSLAAFPQISDLEVKETGSSFTENALLKAQTYGEKLGLATLGEDAGLEVAALQGAPGVHSKRWHQGSDQARNKALLTKLMGVENRQAKFVSVVCLYEPATQTHHCFRGEVLGQITLESGGEAGFGYDPIFIPDGFNQTFAELGTKTKNKLSHRHKALQKLKDYLTRQNKG